MPRHARILSKSETYHVMLRGNERKEVFQDEEDKQRIIHTLFEKKKTSNFLVYAYCIMDNHAHFIIHIKDEPLSTVIKRVGTSYAYYYNKKYKRVGHVFQDRYKSENIENDNYLISAVRYVHNNPVKANICKKAKEYRWSSMRIYLNPDDGLIVLPEIKEVLGIFNRNISKARARFVEFMSMMSEDLFIDIEDNKTAMNENEAIDYINGYLNNNKLKIEDLKKSEYREQRIKFIKELSSISGLSGRQIADLTSINRETVRKSLLSKEPSLRHDDWGNNIESVRNH